MGMLANPGGAACPVYVRRWHRRIQAEDLGQHRRRSAMTRSARSPIAPTASGCSRCRAKGIEIMGFDVVSPNRIEVFNLAGCALTRVTGTPTATQSGPQDRAPAASARRCAATGAGPAKSSTAPQVAAVAPSAPPSTLSRPSPEVCRNKLLDKLGTVGVNQVRAMSDVRFKEPADRRQGAEHEQPAPRSARQRLRRPAHQGDAVRLRRQRHAAVDHAGLGSSCRAGAGADLQRACTRRCRASSRCRRRSHRDACRPTLRWVA